MGRGRRGEETLLFDPGSELQLRGRERKKGEGRKWDENNSKTEKKLTDYSRILLVHIVARKILLQDSSEFFPFMTMRAHS